MGYWETRVSRTSKWDKKKKLGRRRFAFSGIVFYPTVCCCLTSCPKLLTLVKVWSIQLTVMRVSWKVLQPFEIYQYVHFVCVPAALEVFGISVWHNRFQKLKKHACRRLPPSAARWGWATLKKCWHQRQCASRVICVETGSVEVVDRCSVASVGGFFCPFVVAVSASWAV